MKKTSHLFIDEKHGERYYYDVDDYTGQKKRISKKQSKEEYGAW